MKRLLLILASTLALPMVWSCSAEEQSFRGIEHVTGDLYQVQDDNNTYTDPVTGLSTSGSKADLESAEGFEVSAGIRGNGISVDAEYNLISGDTVDPTFIGGVYRNGSTELDKFHIEGGFMFPGNQLELVGSWESLDADNYLDTWEATEVGVNYFWNQHKVKAQLTYRMGENRLGVPGADGDTALLQWQFVF